AESAWIRLGIPRLDGAGAIHCPRKQALRSRGGYTDIGFEAAPGVRQLLTSDPGRLPRLTVVERQLHTPDSARTQPGPGLPPYLHRADAEPVVCERCGNQRLDPKTLDRTSVGKAICGRHEEVVRHCRPDMHVGQPFGGRHPEPARREEAQWPTVQQ